MPRPAHFENMSTHKPLRFCLVGLMPTLAWGGLPAAQTPASDMPLVVVPAPGVDQPRHTLSLRESLRQTGAEEADKPFRLSAQERQQMREQLRSQSFGDRKPK